MRWYGIFVTRPSHLRLIASLSDGGGYDGEDEKTRWHARLNTLVPFEPESVRERTLVSLCSPGEAAGCYIQHGENFLTRNVQWLQSIYGHLPRRDYLIVTLETRTTEEAWVGFQSPLKIPDKTSPNVVLAWLNSKRNSSGRKMTIRLSRASRAPLQNYNGVSKKMWTLFESW